MSHDPPHSEGGSPEEAEVSTDGDAFSTEVSDARRTRRRGCTDESARSAGPIGQCTGAPRGRRASRILRVETCSATPEGDGHRRF